MEHYSEKEAEEKIVFLAHLADSYVLVGRRKALNTSPRIYAYREEF